MELNADKNIKISTKKILGVKTGFAAYLWKVDGGEYSKSTYWLKKRTHTEDSTKI